MSKKIERGFLAKLKKMLINLEAVRTTDGKDLMVDGDIEVGKDIMLDVDGEYEPAPSGEYTTDELVIVVEAGKITEVRAVEVEPAKEEPTDTEAAEDEPPAAVEDDVPALKAEIEGLQAENERLRNRVAELEAENEELRNTAALAAEKPAEAEDETNKETAALTKKFIDNARARQ